MLICLGGVRGRNEATGLGVFYGVREFLQYPEVMEKTGLDGKIAGKTVIVQGFGNVGYWSARFFSQHGARVTGIIERDAAVFNKDGLNVESLFDYFKTTGSFKGYPDAKVIDSNPAHLLEHDCDILVPAALERQISKKNMKRIRAKLIAEGANGPLTMAAHEYLVDNNVIILPDMLMNAGGVTVSYFEWLKNISHVRFGRMNKRWEEQGRRSIVALLEENVGRTLTSSQREKVLVGAGEQELVYSGLEDTMVNACEETRQTANKEKTDYRTAAFLNSLNKIASAYLGSGMMFMR